VILDSNSTILVKAKDNDYWNKILHYTKDIFCFYLLDSSHSYVIFIELLNNRVIVTMYIPMTATGFLVFYRFKAMNRDRKI
jgi:hypothetical protein